MLTTAWVLTEVADGLAATPDRHLIEKILADLNQEPRDIVVPASADLFDRGLQLYLARPDKQWSLTDCISFVVMEERNVTEALTADHHFEQAGFVALLLSRCLRAKRREISRQVHSHDPRWRYGLVKQKPSPKNSLDRR